MIQPSLAGLVAFWEGYPALGAARHSFAESIFSRADPVLGYFQASLSGLLLTLALKRLGDELSFAARPPSYRYVLIC